jgi:hypothetical protein
MLAGINQILGGVNSRRNGKKPEGEPNFGSAKRASGSLATAFSLVA